MTGFTSHSNIFVFTWRECEKHHAARTEVKGIFTIPPRPIGRNPANSVLYLHQLFVCPRPAPRHSICSACNPNYSWPSVPSAVSTQSVHSSVDLILYFDYSHVTDYFSINPKLQP